MNIELSDIKYQKPRKEDQNKGVDLFSYLMFFLFFIVIAWGGYLFWQKTTLNNEKDSLEKSISTTTQKIKELTNSDNPAKKITVAKKLKIIKKDRVLWSEIMAKVIRLNTRSTMVSDFTVNEKGSVQASVGADDFEAIQKFIANLYGREDVSEIVIKSINDNERGLGKRLIMNLDFNLKI